MKKTFIFIIVLSITVLLAEAQQKMSYQAVVRKINDSLVRNQPIGFKISILQGSATGTVVYTETQTPTSNTNGLISIEIGGGSGFNLINWANGPYFIKTETDINGGTNYTIAGTSQLLNVPYALFAKTADYNSLSNLPVLNINNWNTAFGWGNHANAGYLTSFTEVDPKVGLNTTNYISKWNGTSLVSSSIFDNGNVGIGTTNPLSKLHMVNGDIRLDYDGRAPNLDFYGSGVAGEYGARFNIKRARGTTASPSVIGTGDFGFVMYNYFYDGSKYLNAAGIAFGVDNGTIGVDRVPTFFAVSTHPDNTSVAVERFRITCNGNVGIGTTTPSTLLDVNGDLTVRGNIYAPGTVVQTIVRTSVVTSSLNIATFTEANSDYRISIVPKFPNSKFLVEYSFSINTAMTANTVFHMQMIRDIGGSEVLVGVGPTNGSRNRTSYVSRPSNGYDINDLQNVYMVAQDNGLTVGANYTYGFKFRREAGGSGTCYFNYSMGNSPDYGFSGIMTMKITEIAQ